MYYCFVAVAWIVRITVTADGVSHVGLDDLTRGKPAGSNSPKEERERRANYEIDTHIFSSVPYHCLRDLLISNEECDCGTLAATSRQDFVRGHGKTISRAASARGHDEWGSHCSAYHVSNLRRHAPVVDTPCVDPDGTSKDSRLRRRGRFTGKHGRCRRAGRRRRLGVCHASGESGKAGAKTDYNYYAENQHSATSLRLGLLILS